MLIEKIMNANMISISKDTPIAIAQQQMRENGIRHITIINEAGSLIGLISDRDIRDASPSRLTGENITEFLQRHTVEEIMTCEILTAHPLDFIEDISKILFENQIGCVPIVRHGKPIGIVTVADILRTYNSLTGAHVPSTQVEVVVSRNNEQLHEIVSIITSHKAARLLSMVMYPVEQSHTCIFAFRLQTMNPLPIINELREEGFDVLWPCM